MRKIPLRHSKSKPEAGIAYITFMNKFSKLEFLILILAVMIIFISEYYYIVLKDHDRAIFIGLWPPTMLMLLMYLNSKKSR